MFFFINIFINLSKVEKMIPYETPIITKGSFSLIHDPFRFSFTLFFKSFSNLKANDRIIVGSEHL